MVPYMNAKLTMPYVLLDKVNPRYCMYYMSKSFNKYIIAIYIYIHIHMISCKTQSSCSFVISSLTNRNKQKQQQSHFTI